MTEGSYIRGAGATRVDPRRVSWVLAGLAVVGLVVATVWVSVATASDRSLSQRLRQHGVPVSARVTTCSGISSGIGMGIEYYQCRAGYTLEGNNHESLLRGERDRQPAGRVLDAVVVPGDPGTLTLASAVGRSSGGSWTAAVVLMVVTGVAIVGLTGMAMRSRARRRRPDRGQVLLHGGEPAVDGGQAGHLS